MARLSRKQKLRKKQRIDNKLERRSQQEAGRAKKEAERRAADEQERAEYDALPEDERKILEQLRQLRGCLCTPFDFVYPAPKFFEEHNIIGLDEKRVMYVLTNLGPPDFLDGYYPGPMALNWGIFQLACRGCGFEGDSAKLVEMLASLQRSIPGFRFTAPATAALNGLIVPGEDMVVTYSRSNDDEDEAVATITVQFTMKPTETSRLLAERCMALVENGDLRLLESGTFSDGELDPEFGGFVGEVLEITHFKPTNGEPVDFTVNPPTPEQMNEIYACDRPEEVTVRLGSGQELALAADANVDFWVEPV